MSAAALPGANTGWLAALTDAGIQADMSASLVDGVLSFAEATKLAQDIAARGTLTASELSSLQTVVSNLNLSFAADDYTANALSHFLSAGDANDVWTGGSSTTTVLGNLGVGMPSSDIWELANGWFHGADRPDPTMRVEAGTGSTSAPVQYTPFSNPLFGPNGPTAADVNQGFEGDCVVLSAELLMLRNHPDMLQSMFRDNGDGTWGVRFYIGGSEFWETVDNQLPVKGFGTLVYANIGSNGSNSIWAELIEKAYAQLSDTGLIGHPAVDSYSNINSNNLSVVLKAFTGASSTRFYNSSDANWFDDKAVILSAIANGDDILLGTGSTSLDNTYNSSGHHLLVANHAFAVEGYDALTGDFIVRNPWGQQNGQNWVTQFEVSMTDIASVQGTVCIDDTAKTPVRITEMQSIAKGASWPWAHVTVGAANDVSRLFSVTDANGKGIAEYAFQTIGADHLNLNGATNLATTTQQAANVTIIAASDLSKLTFTPGGSSGQTTLMAQAWDGTDYSPTARLTLDIVNAPVLTTPSSVRWVAAGLSTPLEQLVHYDASVNMGTAYFAFVAPPGSIQLNGATNLWTTNAPPGGIDVAASDLAKLTFVAPSDGVVDVQAQVTTGSGWSEWTEQVIEVGRPVAQASQEYDNGQTKGSAAVADTAAHVFSSLDALQQVMTAGDLDHVSVTDTPATAVSLSGSQFQADCGVLSCLSGNFKVSATGLDASQATAWIDALHSLAAGGDLAQASVAGGVVSITQSQLQADANALAMLTGATRVVVEMNGAHTLYSVSQGTNGLVITGGGTTESLSHVDRLQFSDGWLAFDINGDAGQAYRLYQAAFDRTPDVAGLGYQTNALDGGLTLSQVAANFIASPEFQSTYGSVNDTQFITLLYQNVLHRAPDSGGLQYHLNELASGQTRADVLTHFSESPENQANVIGQIQDGMYFTI